jgi:hypothetical protein|uniref:RRM domain-containing protein n=1 Tax=Eutreptiella gymnastica TaxID=73025 RepID=A0A6T2ENE2_9EUGL
MDTQGIQGAVNKLNELKALGIITDTEYQQRKTELIDKALASPAGAVSPPGQTGTTPNFASPGKGFGAGAGQKGFGGKGYDLGKGFGGKGKGKGKGFGFDEGFGGMQKGGWDKGGKGPMWGKGGMQQSSWGPAGSWQGGRGGQRYQPYPSDPNPQSRVLLVTFKDSPFPGHDLVAGHFASCATVEKITHVSKPDREQALVQVASPDEALACVRTLNHSSAEWCMDIDVQKARVQELTFKMNDEKNKSYIALQPGRVLLLTLVGLQGPFPGLDSMYEMFKIYGRVERMSHITKPDREQCMIQFADAADAAKALAGLQDWNMGFCTFNLQVARTDALTFKNSDERNKDYTGQV